MPINKRPTTSTAGSTPVLEVLTDPVTPTAGSLWVRVTGKDGSPGVAMGVLGLTYSHTEIQFAGLSCKLSNGDIRRVRLV